MSKNSQTENTDEQQTATPQNEDAKTVYYLLGGVKYHQETCSWWKGHPEWKVVKCRSDLAEAKGYEPCEDCRPDSA